MRQWVHREHIFHSGYMDDNSQTTSHLPRHGHSYRLNQHPGPCPRPRTAGRCDSHAGVTDYQEHPLQKHVTELDRYMYILIY